MDGRLIGVTKGPQIVDVQAACAKPSNTIASVTILINRMGNLFVSCVCSLLV
ncbi:hypothetical protein [Kingella kingae]|uniref:hypothetical protein n=1 Tax=Kingella kingae TaxID=504 RepID=UPI000404C6E4|nr:hypothetical protein [Kingella kingae]